jgi:CubicO group peptidase (beta-lactamase class C family)
MIKKLVPLLVLFALLSSCKVYLVRSIIYNDPGIKDNKIMPVRIVKKGTPLPLCTSPECNKASIPDSLMKVLKNTGTVAFLVLKDDTVVYEYYKKGYSDSSLTNPFSVTKSIVSILTGVALKEGKIKSLDEPICDYYEPYRKEGLNKITFKNLLCMSSGVSFKDSYLNPAGPTAQIYYGNDMRGLINSFTLEKEPGTEFRYKNCDPEILTLALENAVGMNMSDYASEKLWKPIGAGHDAEWIIDKPKTGVEKSYCCFHTNARDLARIGILYEHKGNWHGTQIVDSGYVKASLTPHNLPRENGKVTHDNGYLWWLRRVDKIENFAADGLKGQFVGVLPKQHLIFVRLGKRDWLKVGTRFAKHHGPGLYHILVRDVAHIWGGVK